MENLKLPVALVAAMAVQLAAGVWWVSQQAATIASLEETVGQIGSRMAIEDNINLKRDVEDNASELENIWDDVELGEREERRGGGDLRTWDLQKLPASSRNKI